MRLHVALDLRSIDFAAEQIPEPAGLGLDFRFQHAIGRNLVSLERYGGDPLELSFVDQEDQVFVARLVAFEIVTVAFGKPLV